MPITTKTNRIETGNAYARGKPSGRRFKTLVVDDEPEIANVAGELLAYHGMDILVAYSAQEALRLLATHTDVDGVFTDVMMPGMTGLELADTVADTHPGIRIVLTSGFTALAYWKQHTRSFPFIEKPYAIEAVIRLLKPG